MCVCTACHSKVGQYVLPFFNPQCVCIHGVLQVTPLEPSITDTVNTPIESGDQNMVHKETKASRARAHLRAALGSLIRISELPCLDGIRAIAVLWVLFFHNATEYSVDINPPDYVGRLVTLSGHMGVDLFFVLSGFLMARMLIKERRRNNGNGADVPIFLLRRWWRLTPPLLLAFIGHTLNFYFLDGETSGHLHSCGKWGWSILAYIGNIIGPGPGSAGWPENTYACMVVTWSLGVEFQFYLVSPFLTWLIVSPRAQAALARYRLQECRILWLLLWASVVLRGVLGQAYTTGQAASSFDGWVAELGCNGYWKMYMVPVYTKVWTRVGPYLSGMIAAARLLGDPACYPGSLWLDAYHGLAVLFTSWFALVPAEATTMNLGLKIGTLEYRNAIAKLQPWGAILNNVNYLFDRTIFGIGVSYFILQILRGRCIYLGRALGCRCWTPIARLSYSIYLLQFISLLAWGKAIEASPSLELWKQASWSAFLVTAAVNLSIVTAASFVAYIFVEYPAMTVRVVRNSRLPIGCAAAPAVACIVVPAHLPPRPSDPTRLLEPLNPVGQTPRTSATYTISVHRASFVVAHFYVLVFGLTIAFWFGVDHSHVVPYVFVPPNVTGTHGPCHAQQ